MSIYIPKTQKASAATISMLEKQFGKRLPQGYLAFLDEHDGAEPENNCFKVSENNNSGIDQFISAEECVRIQETVEGFPKNVVPVARATSGNLVYLNPETGAIFFWDHEVDGDIKVADSFGEFLQQLQPFDPSQIHLKPGQVTKVWVDPGFKPEF